MARSRAPEYGELSSFKVRPDGSVILSVSTIDLDYGGDVLIKYAELAGIAEAAKATRDFADQAKAAKLLTVDYFYTQPKL